MGEGEAGENLELSLQQFGGKADPSFQTQWFVSGQVGEWNWQRWKNADFDKLNTEAESTTDEAKRGELYVQHAEAHGRIGRLYLADARGEHFRRRRSGWSRRSCRTATTGSIATSSEKA